MRTTNIVLFQLGKSNQNNEDYFRDKVHPVWTNGFEESRIIILPNPLGLNFDVLCSMVRATIRGTPYFIYPGSIHDSSLVPKEKAHFTLDIDLIRLSKTQEDLGKAFDVPVDYILEISSGVPLDSAPHVRRSGFGKDLAKFGKLRSFSFYVPFEGQYSHFTTSS